MHKHLSGYKVEIWYDDEPVLYCVDGWYKSYYYRDTGWEDEGGLEEVYCYENGVWFEVENFDHVLSGRTLETLYDEFIEQYIEDRRQYDENRN